MEPRLMETLSDRYEIRRQIGAGGMGTVFLAEDRQLQREVAIKVLNPDLASRLGPERFLREIRITARLQHPNIVPLHDSGAVGDDLYYVMPHIEGESLRERLSREGPLSQDDAVRIAIEIAEGLEYAHGEDVVHRDIKPENILLSSGHAMIADFGVARAVSESGDRLTQSGYAIGTPYYSSPEQSTGDGTVDSRTDIYALGCVLYEMLAGQPPFTGRTAQAIVARHLVELPPPLEVVRPNLAPSVLAVVGRSLEKVAADRYATAADFGAALEKGMDTPTQEHGRVLLSSGIRRSAWIAAVAVAGLLAWDAIRPPTVQLDRNKIVVFPLADSRPGEHDSEDGWGVAIAIGAAFEHTAPLKWIDGWSRLSERERADVRGLSADRARDVALDRAAGYYLDGVIGSDGDSTRVILRLYDVGGDSVVAQESAVASFDSGLPELELRAVSAAAPNNLGLPKLGLQAVTTLLPVLVDPERVIDLSPLQNRSPAAIALWLQGERQYRRAQFLSALDLHTRAVERDSLLVFAAVKGAQAASWMAQLDESEELLNVALRHEELLPERYQALAHGFKHHLAGEADSAIAAYELALEIAPEWPEAAMALGEIYYHFLPSSPRSADSLAQFWFQRSGEADQGFTPPAVHLAEVAIRQGQIRQADSLITMLTSANSDSLIVWRLSLMRDCVRDGSSSESWNAAASVSARDVGLAAKKLSAGGLQVECAKDAFRAVMNHTEPREQWRWASVVGLGGLLVAQGRDSEAVTVFDEALAIGHRGARTLYLFSAIAGADMQSRASETNDFARRAFAPNYEKGLARSRWLVGLWQARYEDGGDVATIAKSLAAEATRTGLPQDALMAASLEVHRILLRGDTLTAIAKLEQLSTTGSRPSVAFEFAPPLAVERSLLARLLLARGDYEGALSIASIFDHPAPITFLPFLAQSLAIRAEAADSLRRPSLASALRDRLAALTVHQVLSPDQ